MSKKAAVPSAWDDDWESQADALDSAPPPKKVVEDESKISKAERLARHAETNKKIWESAQTPENPSGLPFLPPSLSSPVPLATPFKAPLTLLSRRPAPRTITKVDPLTGKTITVEADEEEQPTTAGPTAEELREKAQRELEEKKKRYDEARARILGAPSPGGSGGGRGGSGGNSPRNGTPTPPYGEERGKGRGRGRGNTDRRSDSRNGTRELFDPNYTPKPGSVSIQKGVRSGEASRSGSGRSTPMQREEEQIIRPPRGPDASGKGFGFANRGGKTG